MSILTFQNLHMKLHHEWMNESMAEIQQQRGSVILFWHYKSARMWVGRKASKLHQQNKREVMLQGKRRYSLSLVGYSRLFFSKERILFKKKKKTAMDSSECQWESSELFMLPVDLGTPRYTPISPAPASPATHLSAIPTQDGDSAKSSN